MSKNKDKSCPVMKTSIGGQALIEGIMMRGPKRSAMAVRNMQDEIVIEEWDTPGNSRPGFFKIPVVRGIFNFFDSLKTGYKALTRSAEISTLDAITKSDKPEGEEKPDSVPEEPKPEETAEGEASAPSDVQAGETTAEESPESTPEPAESRTENPDKPEKKDRNARTKIEVKEEEKLSKFQISIVMIIGIVLGLVLAVGLFILAPTYSATGILSLTGLDPTTPQGQIWRSVIEGVIKIILLVGYVAAVALMKDIRRTYMYHGAEHKTIFCYEKRLELTVENVREQSRFHPRCGTSFLVVTMLIAILLVSVMTWVLSLIPGLAALPKLAAALVRVLAKLIILPLIVSLTYELNRWVGGHDTNPIAKLAAWPGKMSQHLTTREPDDGMIECAIAALKAVIPEEAGADTW